MDYLEIRALYHHGIKGQKWGIRRYQNEDGSLTPEGKKRLQDITNDLGRYQEHQYNDITSRVINGEPLPKKYVRESEKAWKRTRRFLKALEKEKINTYSKNITEKGKSYCMVVFGDPNTGKYLEGAIPGSKGEPYGHYRYEYNFIKVKPEKKET